MATAPVDMTDMFAREIGIQSLDPDWLFGGRYAHLPAGCKDRLLDYLQTGEYPGAFLEGVIINDLAMAVNYGIGTEYESWYAHLPLLVKWVYNNCPGNRVGRDNYMRLVKNRR